MGPVPRDQPRSVTVQCAMAVAPSILLVEDNEDDVDLTLRAFARAGLSTPVHVVRDGQHALDALAAVVPLPSVVLLDLNLPRVDGLEVLRRMRAAERTRFVPVVVLTNSVEQRDLVASYTFGCNAFVRKPVAFGELVEAARALGVMWTQLNQLPASG